MAELLLPDAFDRLKVCAEVIRDEADQYDDTQDEELRVMARKAIAAIVPEFDLWRDFQLGIVTDTAFYTTDDIESTEHFAREDGTFYMRGMFADGTLRQMLTPFDDRRVMSSVELCMRFNPNIEAENMRLHQTAQAVVPVSALRDLRIEARE